MKKFKSFGLMIDMSRNAVMSVDGLKRFCIIERLVADRRNAGRKAYRLKSVASVECSVSDGCKLRALSEDNLFKIAHVSKGIIIYCRNRCGNGDAGHLGILGGDNSAVGYTVGGCEEIIDRSDTFLHNEGFKTCTVVYELNLYICEASAEYKSLKIGTVSERVSCKRGNAVGNGELYQISVSEAVACYSGKLALFLISEFNGNEVGVHECISVDLGKSCGKRNALDTGVSECIVVDYGCKHSLETG